MPSSGDLPAPLTLEDLSEDFPHIPPECGSVLVQSAVYLTCVSYITGSVVNVRAGAQGFRPYNPGTVAVGDIPGQVCVGDAVSGFGCADHYRRECFVQVACGCVDLVKDVGAECFYVVSGGVEEEHTADTQLYLGRSDRAAAAPQPAGKSAHTVDLR